jgi:DNA-binding NarL/FixJ family response regulator
MADSSSFRAAKQQLENEMTDRQLRLISIFTDQSKGLAAEKQLLESEVEDRSRAIEKLEAQSCCDGCGTQIAVPETFHVRVAKFSTKVPPISLVMERVRVTMECAKCFEQCDSQQEPEPSIATREEVVQAIEMLVCSKQRQRLTKLAYRLLQPVAATDFDQTGEDLFQEALLRTLDGRRKWDMAAVDFFGHMLGTMQSIYSDWKRKFYKGKRLFEVNAVRHSGEGDELSWIDNKPSRDPSADKRFSGKDELRRLFGKFEEDKVAKAILEAQRDGVATAREIMEQQSLTKRKYEAARRRIRSQKSVLIVEEDYQVREVFVRMIMAMDFAVVTARSASEGDRLNRECGPFDVVILSYSPHGVELAMSVRRRIPSQNMIITTTHCSEEDVVRPSELAHVPILLKPFRRTDLQAALDNFANSAKEQPANRCRQKKRKGTTGKTRRLLQTVSMSGSPRQAEPVNATLPS